MDSSEQTCEEWSSLSGFYTAEEADFMDHLLDNCQVPQYHYGNFNLEIPSTLWPGHQSTIMMNNNSSHFPQNADNSNTDFFSFLQATNSIADTTNIGQEVIADKNFQAPKVFEEVLLSESVEEGVNNNLENSGKRSRSLMKVQKNKGNVKSRKKLKSSFISNTEEEVSPDLKEQNLSSEDDEFNASQELKAGGSSISKNDLKALKSKGKSKSNRGSSAIDPQGVYAKRRRERINERLRILQSLVPNGTKVDISTMLEEAVQYVKFLQLQIKLLSSDDLWMYSPIAYNGMNIGL